MTEKQKHHTLSYLELTVSNVARAKQFYGQVFGWSFVDYGPDYASWSASDAGLAGGFTQGETADHPGSPLAVLYSSNLEATEVAVTEAGGFITVPIFSFPGGRRFHFADPVGNILAVWSE